MQRFLYFAGFIYIALCGAFLTRQIARARTNADPGFVAVPVNPPAPPPAPAYTGTSGAQWFARMKPFCNPVEVEVRERFTPPPSTSEGAGYAAACFALAGKMDRARTIIEAMAQGERASAASVLFEVAHPVADAGDDRASGPMMELVLEYWPNNYMALYHAGMSEYSLGQTELAQKNLRAFLRMYTSQDGFNSNARQALEAMTGTSSDRAQSRRPVEQPPTPVP